MNTKQLYACMALDGLRWGRRVYAPKSLVDLITRHGGKGRIGLSETVWSFGNWEPVPFGQQLHGDVLSLGDNALLDQADLLPVEFSGSATLVDDRPLFAAIPAPKTPQHLRAVKDLLKAQGFQEIKKREINGLADFPQPGQFMGETKVVGHQADVVAVLADKRILCIECKVTNSKVNSRKRLVHDTGGKAPGWYLNLGKANAVVIGVLTGVFSVELCEIAQNEKDVYLIWEHRLQDLADFVGTVP